MKLSKLNEIPSTREMIGAFGGYNHNLRISEGEFYEMTNLTSSEYPSLSPRKKRGIYHIDIENPQGIISKDSLYYVDNGRLYCDGTAIEGFELTNQGEKTLVSMGAYIIISPDMKYINTVDTTDHGKLSLRNEAIENTVFFDLVDKDGKLLGNYASMGIPQREEAPKEPYAGDYWIDTKEGNEVLKQYDSNRSEWLVVDTTYTRIWQFASSNDIGLLKDLAVGDGITLSNITNDKAKFLNTDLIVEKIDANGFVVKNPTGKFVYNASQEYNSENPITLETKLPKLNFIIECNNRLWGCFYGKNEEGEMVNQIYASKLGNFRNWNCLAGISTDSYVASVGTDGPFTGAINYLGSPHFFKENCVHKVYGTMPANFQIQTTMCRGVQAGSSKSLAIVNEVLYYKSQKAVCVYDGSLPYSVSEALGETLYIKAIGGTWGNKYYISMEEKLEATENTANYRLFVYDSAKKMWHKEDDTEAFSFCENRGQLFYIDRSDKKIKIIEAPSWFGEGEIEADAVKWSAETGIIGTDSPDKKYISRLIVRLSMEYGTKVNFFADYDSLGIWEHLFTANGTSLKTFSIPIRPQRCDHLRLRIEGEGEARIFSICKVIEQGSDL